MKQPKSLLNRDIELSAASVLYLVWLLTRASRQKYATTQYNYYDGYQELTQELARNYCAVVGEIADDEVSMFTAEGYSLRRH